MRKERREFVSNRRAYHEFIQRVKHLTETTSPMHEAFGEKVNTNIKTYGGTLKEIPLERVLDPFNIG